MPDDATLLARRPAIRAKHAASLIVLRHQNNEPHMLMGMRGAKHRFMPNRLVFPGGRVDRADLTAPFATPLPHATERHRDSDVGVHRQGFLRLGARSAQLGDLRDDVRIVRVDPVQRHPGGGAYVLEQHLVKGDAAQPVDPFGPAKEREFGR